MALVSMSVQIANGVWINMTDERENVEFVIGNWAVTLTNGDLVIREYPYGGHTQPLLRIPA